MRTHNICFHGEITKMSCGYPLLSRAMSLVTETFKKYLFLLDRLISDHEEIMPKLTKLDMLEESIYTKHLVLN